MIDLNDEKRINSIVNHMKAQKLIAFCRKNILKISTTNFSGYKTILYARLQKNQKLDIDFKCLSGEAKLVLIRKKQIYEICNNTDKQTKTMNIEKGLYRIRLIGNNATINSEIKFL